MRRVVFVDLDDTLFHSRPRSGAQDSLVAVAVGSDGAPATSSASAGLSAWSRR